MENNNIVFTVEFDGEKGIVVVVDGGYKAIIFDDDNFGKTFSTLQEAEEYVEECFTPF